MESGQESSNNRYNSSRCDYCEAGSRCHELLAQVSRPAYSELAEKFPELRAFMVGDKYQFEDIESAYVLAEVLLKQYFRLDIHFDRAHLCPRIANRLDYVLWINDVWCSSSSSGGGDDDDDNCTTMGLDIGTGASGIYSLLACAIKDNTRFWCTDINETSLKYLQKNLDSNSTISSRISLNHVDQSNSFFDLCVTKNIRFSFSMCNPPFYESLQELNQLRTIKSDSPLTKNYSGTDNELFTPGGELQFTLKMLKQSCSDKVRNNVGWFSTMIARKSTVETLVQHLHDFKISNYALHEIAHGRTKRWVVAWSFGQYHVEDKLSRLSGKLKYLNPDCTEISHNLESESLHSESLNNALQQVVQHGAEISILNTASDKFQWKVIVPGDIWSRSFRRQGSKGIKRPKTEYFHNCSSQFLVTLSINSKLRIRWLKGKDRKIFESFSSWLARSVQK